MSVERRPHTAIGHLVVRRNTEGVINTPILPNSGKWTSADNKKAHDGWNYAIRQISPERHQKHGQISESLN